MILAADQQLWAAIPYFWKSGKQNLLAGMLTSRVDHYWSFVLNLRIVSFQRRSRQPASCFCTVSFSIQHREYLDLFHKMLQYFWCWQLVQYLLLLEVYYIMDTPTFTATLLQSKGNQVNYTGNIVNISIFVQFIEFFYFLIWIIFKTLEGNFSDPPDRCP